MTQLIKPFVTLRLVILAYQIQTCMYSSCSRLYEPERPLSLVHIFCSSSRFNPPKILVFYAALMSCVLCFSFCLWKCTQKEPQKEVKQVVMPKCVKRLDHETGINKEVCKRSTLKDSWNCVFLILLQNNLYTSFLTLPKKIHTLIS